VAPSRGAEGCTLFASLRSGCGLGSDIVANRADPAVALHLHGSAAMPHSDESHELKRQTAIVRALLDELDRLPAGSGMHSAVREQVADELLRLYRGLARETSDAAA
jgi:hypothetical protein